MNDLHHIMHSIFSEEERLSMKRRIDDKALELLQDEEVVGDDVEGFVDDVIEICSALGERSQFDHDPIDEY